MLVTVTLCAIFAAQIAPYSPTRQDFLGREGAAQREHLMGTDEFGRDLFSRVIWGAQASLQAGAVAASIALVVGLVLGMLAAYYGARWTRHHARDGHHAGVSVHLAGDRRRRDSGPGLLNAMIAIGIVYVPYYARVVRGAVLSVRAREYVEAARALGAGISGSWPSTCCPTRWRRSSCRPR